MKKRKGFNHFFMNLWRYKALVLMAVPGMLWMIFFFYIPVMANVVAFKNFHISADGFLASLRESPWVGWENFKFLFSSDQAFLITKNTILYNVTFILLNLLIISYFVYAFLSPDKGIFNQWITGHGGEAVNWYNEPKYWPFILVFIGTWKGIGYNSIIYFASVMGIDPTYYEAAMVDGASKWQQIKHVTIPQLIPLMTILTILAVGNLFRADFGLFYNIPRNSGALYDVTQVLDTYIYNGLTSTGDFGMTAAAGLYQSVVGFVLLMITNTVARRFDSDSALF